MLPEEIIKKVKGIELRTKRLVNDVFGGEYHSVFKGRGIEFAEVREYGIGDDIRLIDWNVTARTGHPYVKTFDEERELTVMLVVDASGSGLFGSRGTFKEDLAAEISAVLAFSAIKNNDRVGLIMFTDHIELYIPPQKGRKHVLRVIREILYFKPHNTLTNIKGAIEYVGRILKRKSIVFLISDFMDTGFDSALIITAQKHDVIAISIRDEREEILSDSGVMIFEDTETGQFVIVDTSSKRLRKKYWFYMQQRWLELSAFFKRNGIDHISLTTGKAYDDQLVRFFKKRIRQYR
ncbi:MAG TPA: DUF58 domain-containing protein [Anaerolineae bacterium]|nr:DUF58 domain-containing protein [Anaerolineae bacterium]